MGRILPRPSPLQAPHTISCAVDSQRRSAAIDVQREHLRRREDAHPARGLPANLPFQVFALDDPATLREVEAGFVKAGLHVQGRPLEPEFTDVVATCFARRAQTERAMQALLQERES